ncbi:MAG: outer membrane lipoprotein-sorting protein [Shewanella sp.]|nr:outer membrane lipoprotein-sorting protein [Shewanella sp.]
MNLINRFINICSVTSLLIFGVFVYAQDSNLSADTIIKKANLASYYSGNDGRAEARMKITDNQGRSQIRQFTILRRDEADGGNQDMLVYFSRPSDVKNMVFRVARHPNAQDDRWLYLPGLDLVKRISAGDKRTSFVGSDFFYEDISGRNPSEDNHELIPTNDEQYKVKSIPKDLNRVEFSYYLSWINKNTFLPMKVDYYNKAGKLYRQMKVIKSAVIQEHPVVIKVSIKNLANGNSTIMQMRGIAFDLGIPQQIFNERSLRNPPSQWLRGKR